MVRIIPGSLLVLGRGRKRSCPKWGAREEVEAVIRNVWFRGFPWQEANRVLGVDDPDKCTYEMGYRTRQAVFACLTCTKDQPAGVCTACALRCHDSHEARARSNPPNHPLNPKPKPHSRHWTALQKREAHANEGPRATSCEGLGRKEMQTSGFFSVVEEALLAVAVAMRMVGSKLVVAMEVVRKKHKEALCGEEEMQNESAIEE